jgi:predicted transcriptional regulator
VADALGLRRATVATLIAHLIEAGLMTLKTPAVKPAAMGAAGPGRAAVYDLPHRHKGGVVRFEQGDKRLPGFAKAWCDELRSLTERLSKPAARVLLIVAAVPRQRDGTLLRPDEEVDLTSATLARDLPGMSERTARRAVAELVELGLVRLVRARAGRRAARYQPAGLLITRIARRKRPSQSGGFELGTVGRTAAPCMVGTRCVPFGRKTGVRIRESGSSP